MVAQLEYYLNFLLQTRGAEEGDEEDGKEILNVFICSRDIRIYFAIGVKW